MLNQIKYELQILLKRGKFSKLLLIETCLISLYCIVFLTGKNASFYGSKYDFYFLLNYNHVTISYCLILIVPILSSLAHGDVGYQEDTMKYSVISRGSRKNYDYARRIMIFIVGLFNIFYVLEIMYIFQYFALDVDLTYYYTGNEGALLYLIPNNEAPFFSFLYNNPFLYYQTYILVISIFGGCTALLAYELDQLFHNQSTMYVNGFLLVLGVSFILQFFGKYQMWSYFYLFTPNIWGINNDLFVCIGWIIWAIAFFIFITIIGSINRRKQT